jgi:hypothetical protein
MFSQPAVRHTTHTYVPAVLYNYGVILLLCAKQLGHEISNWLIINVNDFGTNGDCSVVVRKLA